MAWEIFERAASSYEAWYATPRGRRADQAERELLARLLTDFPTARRVLEVGCGTGHFTAWLAAQGLQVLGLERAPAMLAHLHQRLPRLPVICADAHHLPVHTGAVDLVLFVTTLEFLDNPVAAVTEAVRVARQGLILLVLNRWSVGGLSRRWGPQARRPLLSQAHDYSLVSLRALVQEATGQRLHAVRWASTLLPDGLWRVQVSLPVGDVIGMTVKLNPPLARPVVVPLRRKGVSW